MFRIARSEDIDMLHQLIVAEAGQGRFDKNLVEEPYRSALRRNIRNIRRKGQRLDEHLQAQLLVWESDGMVSGCAINSEILPGVGNEIWMLAVFPDNRGKGVGSAMNTELLRQLHPYVDIFARCAPKAEVACKMFLRSGFISFETTEQGVRILKLPKAGVAPTASKHVRQMLEPYRKIKIQ